MLKTVWMLSKFYTDESCLIHPRPQVHPVAHDYAESDFCPVRPGVGFADEDEWALVHVTTDSERIALAKQDPRIVYCGTAWDAPPQRLLDVYASRLAGSNYIMLGQVLLKLAEFEPLYHPE
jgi:hypothetical protein